MQKTPCLVAIDMGYGHLRPAHAIGEYLNTPVMLADKPPLAHGEEIKQWNSVRRSYEKISRASQLPIVGAPLRWTLDSITSIPEFYPERDLSTPTLGTMYLHHKAKKGLGRDLVRYLQEQQQVLLTTYYSPAIVADRLGYEHIYCVVTDSDINRVWAPKDAKNTKIRYLAPSQRARRRLRSYGVPDHNITVTGFPLPHELVGGTELLALKRNLARRLERLDKSHAFRTEVRNEIRQLLGPDSDPPSASTAPLLTYAVGGSGAQTGLVDLFLPSLRSMIEKDQLRVCLVAGVRPEVEERMKESIKRAKLEQVPKENLWILKRDSFEEYFREFNQTLARTDLLWTKPSEMTFFGALGIPLIFSRPVGVHERYNRRWAVQSGVGLKQHNPRYAAGWIRDWLKDGVFAAAAWSGFVRMPKYGLYQICDAIESRLT